jgi:hypothetical protein
MNQTELEAALARGVRLAVGRAFKWSANELWPGDTGAENLIQVSVAEAIHRTATIKPAIHLEPTLSRIDPEAFPNDTRRVDIGLMWRGSVGKECGRYFSVVEVKKYPRSHTEDLEKICSVLDHVDSVRHGYLVTYFQKRDADKHGKKTLDDLMEQVADDVMKAAETTHGRPCSHVNTEVIHKLPGEGGTWRAAALVLRFDRASSG